MPYMWWKFYHPLRIPSMINRIILITILLLQSCYCIAQSNQEEFSFSDEIEDSISALYIKPIPKPEMLLKRIVERLQFDQKREHDVGRYLVEATFSQGTLVPFSASLVISAERGIGLEKIKKEKFSYEGPYTLAQQDTFMISDFLVQFAALSPLHAHKAYWEEYKAMSPLANTKETMRCYDVTADSIADEKGRAVLRFRFEWKKRQRKDFDWERYQGEITGSAYFNSRTLQLKQFKGEAHLPSFKYSTRLRYMVDYHKSSKSPVLKQITILGTKDDMVMRATVREFDE